MKHLAFGITILAALICCDEKDSSTNAPRHESSDQALARPSSQPVTDPFRRDESHSADRTQPQQMLIAEAVDHGKKPQAEAAPQAEEAPQANEKQQAKKNQLGVRELERETPEVLPRKYRRPSDETLQTIEYFLDRKSGLKVVRGWGIEARLRSDEGHSQDLVAFRVIGPGCEDGRFIGVCTLKPCNPVSGAATAFMESLPNRNWNAADKAAQRLVELAEALRDGKVVLHEDRRQAGSLMTQAPEGDGTTAELNERRPAAPSDTAHQDPAPPEGAREHSAQLKLQELESAIRTTALLKATDARLLALDALALRFAILSPDELSTRADTAWAFSETVHPLDDSRVVTLWTDSISEIGTPPLTHKPKLVIRQRGDALELFIQTRIYIGDKRTLVTERIDSADATKSEWIIGTDHKSVFCQIPKRKLQQYLAGQKLVVSLSPYAESPVIFGFDLRGLGEQVGRLMPPNRKND